MMIVRLLSQLHHLLEYAVRSVLIVLTYVALGIAIGYQMGWLERWIWFIVEKEAKTILNNAKVTIGSFQIDWSELLQGKITLHASNIVIHTPKRTEWQWESPLVARIGKASVECNAPICIFHDLLLRREIPIEAYTVIVSDVQVFVERRDSVINVYLLNPTLIVPPPPKRQESKFVENRSISSATMDETVSSLNHKPSSSDVYDMSNSKVQLLEASETKHEEELDPTDSSNEQAKKLVIEMLHAVQDLGRAATRGQLPGAIKQQGLELVDRLKGFREQDNLEEGLRVMQQVGKVAVESLQKAPQLILPRPDDTKKGKIVHARVGRIVMNDMRIFTKDSWINPQDDENYQTSTSTGTSSSHSARPTELPSRVTEGVGSNDNHTTAGNSKTGGWNKPIFIERMVVRASELSPPMSMKDDRDLPAIYQNVDRIVEIVWRRLLAEMAKSNTGKLFSAAMGEVLGVMITNRQLGNATTTIGAASTVAHT